MAGEDAAHVGALEHLRERGLVTQLDEHREVEHTGQRRVVHRQHGAVRCAERQLLGQPVELRRRHLTVMVTGHARVEGDDPQPVHVVDPVDRASASDLAEQAGTERGTLVVVAHDPDHLGAEAFGSRFDDRTQAVVCLRFAAVCQVAGEDDGLGSTTRSLDLHEQFAQVALAVYPVVKPRVAREQVGVAEVEQKVVRPRILGRSSGHEAKSIT